MTPGPQDTQEKHWLLNKNSFHLPINYGIFGGFLGWAYSSKPHAIRNGALLGVGYGVLRLGASCLDNSYAHQLNSQIQELPTEENTSDHQIKPKVR